MAKETKKTSNKWSKGLNQLEGYVDPNYDAYASENCVYTPSPSINSLFANKSHGIPKGAAMLLYGEQKTGKTFLINSILEKMCLDDPEGIALFYNSEMRTKYQSGQSEGSSLFQGIDRDRVKYFDSNRPEDIFDVIERDILPMVLDGMPLRYIIIDSLSDVAGTKSMVEGRSVNDALPGDDAQTVKKGLNKIKHIIKKHNIVLISTVHMVANFDIGGGGHGPKKKAKTTAAIMHGYDYFLYLKKAGAAEDKVSLTGEAFVDENRKDARGEKELTGHKIIVKMDASSFGVAGRSATITLNFNKGITNIEEEIFDLCKNAGIIEYSGGSAYTVYGEKIIGKGKVATMIKESPDLQKKLLTDLKALDSKAITNV